MGNRVLMVGFDDAEARALAGSIVGEAVCHEMVPRIVVEKGELFVESPRGANFLRIAKVVFHGIFENDTDFLTGVGLWGGPCFPNPLAMIDCRPRMVCLLRTLRWTRFGGRRDYAAPGTDYDAAVESVAKWGNWHCGENKARIKGRWSATEATSVEPFVAGEAVRVVIVGGVARQIRLTGPSWLKSVHGTGAELMPVDAALEADTRAVQAGLGLDIIANDYILGPDGPYLLEVNHIPSVTCFPELWADYMAAVQQWLTALDAGTARCG